jgi:hypothetical protein
VAGDHNGQLAEALSDTTPDCEARRARIFREMTAARKLELVDDAIRTSRQLLRAGLRQRHPGASEEALERRLLGLVLGEDLATSAYGPAPTNSYGQLSFYNCR